MTELALREHPVPGPVPLFEIPGWRQRFGVVAGITGRGTGLPFDLGLSPTRPVSEAAAEWDRLRAALPWFSSVVASRQVHGDVIGWHGPGRGWRVLDGLDGHGTASPGTLLAITVADCIPVYLVDPVARLILLLHAGWRGVAAGLLGRGLDQLATRGSSLSDVVMHCGVGICGQCYEVGPEVLAGCGEPVPSAEKGTLDLRSVLRRQGCELGVGQVSTSQFCSSHDTGLFFSHRASAGRAGRMVAYLGLLP